MKKIKILLMLFCLLQSAWVFAEDDLNVKQSDVLKMDIDTVKKIISDYIVTNLPEAAAEEYIDLASIKSIEDISGDLDVLESLRTIVDDVADSKSVSVKELEIPQEISSLISLTSTFDNSFIPDDNSKIIAEIAKDKDEIAKDKDEIAKDKDEIAKDKDEIAEMKQIIQDINAGIKLDRKQIELTKKRIKQLKKEMAARDKEMAARDKEIAEMKLLINALKAAGFSIPK